MKKGWSKMKKEWSKKKMNEKRKDLIIENHEQKGIIY